MKKYCIKTFEKFKSNAVGVGVLDDPLVEQKHINKITSNNQTSNIKNPMSNAAITLIALIITIIVLLILAGVTLNMVMGENGLFGKANTAKEQTQKSTAEETIKLAVLENNAKDAAGETALNELELKAEISKKLKELGYTVAEDNNTVTYYGDKTINIEDYFEKDTEKTTGITAKDVQKHPDWYYGKTVTNYTSSNGQNDWKIFYSDGNHIFLITGDYINTAETNKINTTATGMTTSGYNAYWVKDSVPEFKTVDSTVLTRFKATEYNINEHKENQNAQCVSTLLNANNWTSYLDEEINGKRNAEYAIGSPTIEMWVESWNKRYSNSSDKIYCNNTNSNGYYVGISSNQSTYNFSNSKKEGYNNKLYYPHIESSGYNGTYGYWIASTSAVNGYNVLYVDYEGNVGNYSYGHSAFGLRPVVSLKSGTTVNAEDAD